MSLSNGLEDSREVQSAGSEFYQRRCREAAVGGPTSVLEDAMTHHLHSAGAGDEQQARIYRRTALTTDHIGRFVTILIRELFEGEGLRYDAMYIALAESGIQPLPSLQCEAVHFDARVDRQNVLADVLIEDIAADEAIRAAIARLALTLLDRLTVPAPDRHLEEAELDRFVACCLAKTGGGHIAEYDEYAALHAHVGTCAWCDHRLRAKHASATSQVAQPHTW